MNIQINKGEKKHYPFTKSFGLRGILLSLTLILSAPCVQASGLANLMKYAQSNGTMTNVNKGKVVSDQKAGYITGGSIISRGPKPETLRPLVVQPPGFEFDPCTRSYDARFGGISFIKGKAFTEFIKAVPGVAGAYALKMLIKEVCPQCEDIATYLETVARDINGLTMQQCAIGKSIAQGGLAMLNSASQQSCMMKSNIQEASSDLFEATESCTDNPDRFGAEGEDDQLKSLLGDNFNLVWKALSQGDSSAKTGLKELMMSISGSVIGTKTEGVMAISNLPSLVEKEDLIERYIGKPGGQSGELVIYRCNENKKCLAPVEKTEVVDSDQTLYGNVTTLLESIFKKIDDNEGELSDDEQALIEFSSIPLITIIEIELSAKDKASAASLVGMHEFVEVVCYDLITNYMQKMLTTAKASVEVLKTAQLDNTAIDKFTNNVEVVRGYLRDKRFEAFKKLQVIIQVKERLSQQQSVFELGFSRFMDVRGQ